MNVKLNYCCKKGFASRCKPLETLSLIQTKEQSMLRLLFYSIYPLSSLNRLPFVMKYNFQFLIQGVWNPKSPYSRMFIPFFIFRSFFSFLNQSPRCCSRRLFRIDVVLCSMSQNVVQINRKEENLSLQIAGSTALRMTPANFNLNGLLL